MATSRYHRPQYSYLHLIQMAISSSPEKQMTLKQIYHWIEDNFPYYGYTSNQGWKVTRILSQTRMHVALFIIETDCAKNPKMGT